MHNHPLCPYRKSSGWSEHLSECPELVDRVFLIVLPPSHPPTLPGLGEKGVLCFFYVDLLTSGIRELHIMEAVWAIGLPVNSTVSRRLASPRPVAAYKSTSHGRERIMKRIFILNICFLYIFTLGERLACFFAMFSRKPVAFTLSGGL